MSNKALVAGISGQTGSLLAKLLLERGFEVTGTSRASGSADFWRLKRLGILDDVELVSLQADDRNSVCDLLSRKKPNRVYYLAGPSSVGLSFEQPFETFTSNVIGGLNFLEAIRTLNLDCRFFNAVSTDCFGNQPGVVLDESSPFKPVSPYAIAKTASYWNTVGYRDNYGIFASNGILSNHESPLRGEPFVTHKIMTFIRNFNPKSPTPLRLGNTSIRRDWVWAPEVVEAIFAITEADAPSDYIVATGKSHSLQDMVEMAAELSGLSDVLTIESDSSLVRKAEIPSVEVSVDRIEKEVGWKSSFGLRDLVAGLLEDK